MQAESVERTAATFAVFYNTEWRARGLPDPQDFPKALRPMRIAEAVEHLTSKSELRSDADAAIASGALALSLAQLARAHSRTIDVERFARELLPAWRSLSRTDRADTDLLETMLNPGVRSPDERFFRTFEAAFGRLFRLRNFAVSWSFRNRVTDVCATIETTKAFDAFPYLMDPRNWSENASLVWERSDPIQAIPADIRASPEKLDTAGPYDGPFFEVALFSLLARISEYYNVLRIGIDFDGDRPPPGKSFGFTFSQNLCLHSSLFFGLFEGPGGIDVDQGFGRCEDIGHGFTRLTAYKRARFDQPRGLLNVLYNSLGTIYLKMLIEAFVLFAAVIDPRRQP